jgi:hypothetical protein
MPIRVLFGKTLFGSHGGDRVHVANGESANTGGERSVDLAEMRR